MDFPLDHLADELAEMILERMTRWDRRVVGPTAAGRILHDDPRHFSPSRYPWRVPYHGARGIEWPVWKWDSWNKVPDGARRRQWDAIPLRARAKIQGVA